MSKSTAESELQSLLRANDRSAFKKMYTDYREEFLNFSKRYGVAHDDAVDVYQDATVALFQKFVSEQFEIKHSTVKTYLFGIAKNKLYQVLKKNSKKVDFEWELNVEAEKEINEEVSEDVQKLATHLNSISESCQRLIKMFYYRNLTIDEIVELTEYSDGNTVRSHKSRCVKRLKKLFGVIK